MLFSFKNESISAAYSRLNPPKDITAAPAVGFPVTRLVATPAAICGTFSASVSPIKAIKPIGSSVTVDSQPLNVSGASASNSPYAAAVGDCANPSASSKSSPALFVLAVSLWIYGAGFCIASWRVCKRLSTTCW